MIECPHISKGRQSPYQSFLFYSTGHQPKRWNSLCSLQRRKNQKCKS